MKMTCHSSNYTCVFYVTEPKVRVLFSCRIRLTDQEYREFPVGPLSPIHERFLSPYQRKLLRECMSNVPDGSEIVVMI